MSDGIVSNAKGTVLRGSWLDRWASGGTSVCQGDGSGLRSGMAWAVGSCGSSIYICLSIRQTNTGAPSAASCAALAAVWTHVQLWGPVAHLNPCKCHCLLRLQGATSSCRRSSPGWTSTEARFARSCAALAAAWTGRACASRWMTTCARPCGRPLSGCMRTGSSTGTTAWSTGAAPCTRLSATLR